MQCARQRCQQIIPGAKVRSAGVGSSGGIGTRHAQQRAAPAPGPWLLPVGCAAASAPRSVHGDVVCIVQCLCVRVYFKIVIIIIIIISLSGCIVNIHPHTR